MSLEHFVTTDQTPGIAWIAVEGGPILFKVIGLGLGGQPP